MTDNPSKTLILELARSLHASGSPAYELDHRMEQVAAALGQPATFFSTPTALFVTFDDEPHGTRLLRVYPGDTNLALYAELFHLQESILNEAVTVPAAREQLQAIRATRDEYPILVQVASFGIVGGCVAVLVGGDETVVVSAGVIALIIGGLVPWLSRMNYPIHLTNVIAGLVAGTAACTVQVQMNCGNYELASLCALIVLVPGLTLTISINELATQNLASGSARLAGAMTTLLTLIFGVFIGCGLIAALKSIPVSAPPRTPSLLLASSMVVPVALGLAVLFRTRGRDIPWLVVSTLISYSALRLSGEFFSPFAAVWIASVVSGVASNLLSRWLNLPPAVMLMPALILLVPGSLGFTGVAHIMLHADLPGGVRLLTTMFLTAVAIVAGQLVTDVIVSDRRRQPPRKADR